MLIHSRPDSIYGFILSYIPFHINLADYETLCVLVHLNVASDSNYNRVATKHTP